MKLVFVHLKNLAGNSGINITVGDALPPHFYTCLEHTKKYFKEEIILLTDVVGLNKIDGCTIANANEYIDKLSASNLIRGVGMLARFGDFWINTTKRLFVLNDYLKKTGYENVIHMENDILIYHDFTKYEDILKKLFKDKVAVNPVGPSTSTFACSYIDNYGAMDKVCEGLMRLMQLGEAYIIKNSGETMAHEMSMLKILVNEKNDFLEQLPSLPDDKYFSDFDSLFDGASWGQYVGGSHNAGNPWHMKPGFRDERHFIGAEIAKGNYDVIWENKIPYALQLKTNKRFRINNLHIHTKELEKYV